MTKRDTYTKHVHHIQESVAHATAESRRHHAEQDRRTARALRGRQRFVAAHGRPR